MALRKSDFVAWRINWKDKAENLVELAEELNLGLDSFVFLDDSPQERDQIRQILPQVYTPDLPSSPSEFAPFLSSLDCFETPNLGKEDLDEPEMYRAERDRKEALDLSGDVETWLRSPRSRCVQLLCAVTISRGLPNCSTRRTSSISVFADLDEKSFWEWSEEPCNSTYTFHVADRFGDFGLAGLSSVSRDGSDARIVDFVMSCRVMGKRVEEALLGYTLTRAEREAGADRIVASPVDGPEMSRPRSSLHRSCRVRMVLRIMARVAIPSQITLKEEC